MNAADEEYKQWGGGGGEDFQVQAVSLVDLTLENILWYFFCATEALINRNGSTNEKNCSHDVYPVHVRVLEINQLEIKLIELH